MGELKNKQHYIFQAYLKAWENEDKKIWVYKKNDKKIFPASTRDVLNKRRLYQLRNMNSDEKNFFELCMEVFKLNDESKAEMRNHIAAYLLPFSNQKLVNALKKINPIPKDHELTPEIQNHFDELDRANEEAIVNTEEDFYSDYESDGEGWIRKILMQDLDFYYPSKIEAEEMIPSEKYAERDDFINFLCIQYFRTCEMRDTMVKNISNMLKLAESKKVWMLIVKISIPKIFYLI